MYRGDVHELRLLRARADTLLALAALLFVLTWPLEKRHLVLTEYSFITGAYTEAGTIALYVSDLVFPGLASLWLWAKLRALRNPHTETPWSLPISHTAFWVGVGFVCWAALRAIPLTPSALGWYAALRIAQGFLLFLITADLWKLPRVRTVILTAFLVVAVFQAVLGSAQVFKGSDLGLQFLGEPRLSIQTPGVAKVDLNENVPTETSTEKATKTIETAKQSGKVMSNVPTGTKVLRGYGTFPHPNILGGFLALALFITILIYFSQIFAVETRGTFSARMVRNSHMVIFTTILLITVGLVLTFSRSSWYSIIISLAFLVSFYRNIGKKQLFVLLLCMSLTIGTLFLFPGSPVGPAIKRRFSPLQGDMFLQERSLFLQDALSAIRDHPLLGVGTGRGVISLVQDERGIDFYGKNVPVRFPREPWQYQHPHAVPVVIVLELGFLGAALFSVFLFLALKGTVLRSLNLGHPWGALSVLLLVAATLPPLLGDHYLWTTQAGRILLWGLLGVLASTRERP